MIERAFRILEFITAFVQLNLLWLLFCAPIITIFPATVAMFCVVRQWVLHKDYSLYRPFFKYFKENFKQSFILGIIWIIFTSLFFLNLNLVQYLGSFKYIFIPILYFFGITVLFISIFIFSTIAHFNTNWLEAIKNSFFFSIRFFPTSIGSIMLLVLVILSLYTWPITFIFIVSLYAYYNYMLCHRIFLKVK
ncbi:YesL family protein [Litchfieldia alkalitelluris]|uniref:YesL family protein n=1 Tax=Litchfieldia alkalitelluris TaxID=304268 RepID=UPI00099876E2